MNARAVALRRLRSERARSIALLEELGYMSGDSALAATSTSPYSASELEREVRTAVDLLDEHEQSRRARIRWKPEPEPEPEPEHEPAPAPAPEPAEEEASEPSVSEEEEEESEHDSDSSYVEQSHSSSQSSSLTVEQPSPSDSRLMRRQLKKTAARKVRAFLLRCRAFLKLTTFSRVCRRSRTCKVHKAVK
jgi:outer membrane biosynthesis protein TonB